MRKWHQQQHKYMDPCGPQSSSNRHARSTFGRVLHSDGHTAVHPQEPQEDPRSHRATEPHLRQRQSLDAMHLAAWDTRHPDGGPTSRTRRLGKPCWTTTTTKSTTMLHNVWPEPYMRTRITTCTPNRGGQLHIKPSNAKKARYCCCYCCCYCVCTADYCCCYCC